MVNMFKIQGWVKNMNKNYKMIKQVWKSDSNIIFTVKKIQKGSMANYIEVKGLDYLRKFYRIQHRKTKG